uniref:Uncharacterized protein n=1 Tax=Arundo donax TaxID=35708 RepID=A0A0A9HXR6_ARUDO
MLRLICLMAMMPFW